MKPYGFKISDGKVTYTRWFGSYGTTDGLPAGYLDRIIRAQHCLVFHQAYAYSKAAAMENGLGFYTLYEADYLRLGNPLKRFFKKLFKGIKQQCNL